MEIKLSWQSVRKRGEDFENAALALIDNINPVVYEYSPSSGRLRAVWFADNTVFFQFLKDIGTNNLQYRAFLNPRMWPDK